MIFTFPIFSVPGHSRCVKCYESEYFTEFIRIKLVSSLCVLGIIFSLNPNTCLFVNQSLEKKTVLTGGETTWYSNNSNKWKYLFLKKILTVQNDQLVEGQCVWSVVQHQMLLVVVYRIMRYVGRKNELFFR